MPILKRGLGAGRNLIGTPATRRGPGAHRNPLRPLRLRPPRLFGRRPLAPGGGRGSCFIAESL